MRLLPTLVGIALLCTIGVVSAPVVTKSWNLARAQEKAETPPPAPAAVADKISDNAVAAIAPHRAIYTLRMLSVRNGSDISAVSGKMMFEWNDVCDGWAVRQYTQLRFNYTDGDAQDVTTNQLSWEAKDGSAYNFNVRRSSNGKETEIYRGKATMDDKGGSVIYSEPQAKTVTLDKGTLFPSAHTVRLLQIAQSGEKLFSRRVFDGGDEAGVSEVSAFIFPHAQTSDNGDEAKHGLRSGVLPASIKDKPLLQGATTPVRLAFFAIDGENGTPDYEMDIDLLGNGIAKVMKVDYGDYAVIGVLEDVEPLATPECR